MSDVERDLADVAREVIGQVPMPVEIMTFVEDDGTRRGMTISSLAQVSADPPSVLMCIGPQAEARSALVPGKGFCISILASDQVPEALGFAYGTEDPFEVFAWEPAEDGTPVVSGSAASLFCEVENVVMHHDTAVVLSKVTGGEVHKDEALVYWRQKYYGDFVRVMPEVTGTW
jgi:flavin reductase (DIM6/NTAB) family NADH-FMN oxidoreductase RutF